jgi:K+-transporting ATPase ATPase C chain
MVRRQLLSGLLMVLVMTALVGLAYPLVVTGVAQAAFHDKANGSLVQKDGQDVGSSLIGQSFTDPRYFHPRPSAAGADGYDPASSAASNLGPTNETLAQAFTDRATAYRTENRLAADAPVPVDAITASGSGLDPDISIDNARLQAPRVAEARRMTTDAVLALVDAHTTSRTAGALGEPTVNVLELNLALDASAP